MSADLDFQTPRSLLEVIASALTDIAAEAKQLNVDFAWTVDPALPAYISVKRVDLFAIISVLLRRALEVVDDQALHLTVASTQDAAIGQTHVLLQLEDFGQSIRQLDAIAWQQLEFWIEELGGKLQREATGLFWSARLPLDQSNSPIASVASLRSGLKVLVVCPDTDTRSKILHHVHAARHQVVECKNQHEALILVAQERFHLILIDADLEDGDGLSLAQSLREHVSKLIIALMSTDVPISAQDFSWIKLWMPKPPPDAELNFAYQTAMNHRRQRLEARLARSGAAAQSA